jgi:hypothetical protein
MVELVRAGRTPEPENLSSSPTPEPHTAAASSDALRLALA